MPLIASWQSQRESVIPTQNYEAHKETEKQATNVKENETKMKQ